MTESTGELRRHRLVHLGALRIDEGLLRARYPEACATSRCTGKCCVAGVWTDPQERDVIVAHADFIRKYMDPGQTQDPGQWFAESRPDADFPSGSAVATAVINGRCAFLNVAGRCVLQKACETEPERGLDLKPFFCTAFPVTIDTGRLEIGEGYDENCCIYTSNGTRDVLDLCPKELGYVLGREGHAELEQIARTLQEPSNKVDV